MKIVSIKFSMHQIHSSITSVAHNSVKFDYVETKKISVDLNSPQGGNRDLLTSLRCKLAQVAQRQDVEL